MNSRVSSYSKNIIFGASRDRNAVIKPYCLTGVTLTYRRSGGYVTGIVWYSSRSYQRGLKRYTTIRRTIRRRTIRSSGNPVGAIIGVACCVLCYCCVGAIWFLFFRAVAQAGAHTNVVVVGGGGGDGECVEEVVEEVVVDDGGYEGGSK